ncbi:MAG: hypothetical protein WAV56_03425 [Microgenomates group bacterium]
MNGGHHAPQTSGTTAETSADYSAATSSAPAAPDSAHPALTGTMAQSLNDWAFF